MSGADGSSFGQPDWRGRLLVLAAGLLAYIPALRGPFQFDDAGVIVNERAVHSLSAYGSAAGHGLRPLLKLSYALDWSFGTGPLGFHATNLIVHLLAVDLVMRLASACDRSQRFPFPRMDARALIAGALFALHPIHTEAVTYVSGRSSSLSTCFVLLACLAYVASARPAGSAGSARSVLALGLALVCFACAVLTKETCATLPLALLLWELFVERAGWRAAWKRQAVLWGLSLLLLSALVMHRAYFALLYAATGTRPLAQSLLHQVAGVGYLASRLSLLRPPCIDPGLGLHPPTQLALLLSAGLCTGLLALAAAQRRARPLLAFGAAWFLLHTLLPYVLVPRIDVINERHAYLADVGAFIALGALGQAAWPGAGVGRRRALVSLGMLLTAFLFALTLARNAQYRSEVALWQSTVRVAPDNPRAHHNLGVAYERDGRFDLALREYRSALQLEPRFALAREGLARLSR